MSNWIEDNLWIIFAGALLLVVSVSLYFAVKGPSHYTLDRTMQGSGLKIVSLDGRAWLRCGKEDAWSQYFTATRADSGTTVSGFVCCGPFKGCTVRW